MVVRSAAPTDADTIAQLLGELGYPATAAEVAERLKRLGTFSTATAMVAEIDGVVAGVATGHVLQSIHATPVAAWLTTLVVGAASRSHGIGRRLVAAIEAWARDAGAERMSVTSGTHRDGAHAFYERVGYERSGLRLTKRLT